MPPFTCSLAEECTGLAQAGECAALERTPLSQALVGRQVDSVPLPSTTPLSPASVAPVEHTVLGRIQ